MKPLNISNWRYTTEAMMTNSHCRWVCCFAAEEEEEELRSIWVIKKREGCGERGNHNNACAHTYVCNNAAKKRKETGKRKVALVSLSSLKVSQSGLWLSHFQHGSPHWDFIRQNKPHCELLWLTVSYPQQTKSCENVMLKILITITTTLQLPVLVFSLFLIEFSEAQQGCFYYSLWAQKAGNKVEQLASFQLQ